jgi:hypothetical protein
VIVDFIDDYDKPDDTDEEKKIPKVTTTKPTTNKPKSLSPHTRKSFTESEDERILDFLEDNVSIGSPKGKTVYEVMEKEGIVDHTWQSVL